VSFRDKQWNDRLDAMGDEAEGVFEAVAPANFVRYGINRPPLQVHRLPARIRFTPDYLMTNKFVEVQGCGRDQTFKLKVSKHGALRWWNDLHAVELFLWDSHNCRWCFVTLEQLESLLVGTTVRAFPEGHPYFEFNADDVFGLSTRTGTYNPELAA